MRAGSLAILGVAAYVAFLVGTMPASWLQARVAVAPGRHDVHSINGTLWKGDARAVLHLPGVALVIDRVHWDFRPMRLLQGRLAYDITLKGAGFDASCEVARSLGGWSVRRLEARADAALAAAALPLAAPWRPEGRLAARAESIDLDGNDVRGELRVDWKDAATSLSSVRPLGSYRVDLTADGPGANIGATTEAGALRIAGRGRIDWPSRLTFSGEARAAGGEAAALAPILDLIGPARPDGARAIELRSR